MRLNKRSAFLKRGLVIKKCPRRLLINERTNICHLLQDCILMKKIINLPHPRAIRHRTSTKHHTATRFARI